MTDFQTATKTNSIFSLNRLKQDCYYLPVRVDFEPPLFHKDNFTSIIPEFNSDHRHYTPSFVLPSQKVFFQQNHLTEKNKIQQSIQKQTRMASQQDVSQGPSSQQPELEPSDSKFCQICQLHFEEYWEHISEKYHKRKSNATKYNFYIQELCEKYCRPDRPLIKTKKISKPQDKLKKFYSPHIQPLKPDSQFSLELLPQSVL